MAAGLAVIISGCGGEAARKRDRGAASPASAAATASAAPGLAGPEAGLLLSEVRRGCGPSDFVGVVGRVTGPPGLLDLDGLRVEVRSAGGRDWGWVVRG